MQPVVTIFNKPVSDNSGVYESNKHILSEGRADLIGKRFAFDQGHIRPLKDEAAFFSATHANAPMYAAVVEDLQREADLDAQKRKFSNHLEYNLSQSLVEPFPKNTDPSKASRLTTIKEDNPSPPGLSPEALQEKPTTEDIGTVKLGVAS